MKIIIPVLLLCLIAGIYTFYYLKSHIGTNKTRFIYLIAAAGIIIYSTFSIWEKDIDWFSIFKTIAIVVIFYTSVTLPITLFAFIEDLYRVVKRLVRSSCTPVRNRYVFICSVIFSISGLITLLYSSLHTKTHWKVHNIDVYSHRLPVSMDSMRVVQISDLHIGSFDIKTNDSIRLSQAMDIINSLRADVIVFTGDIVNGNASEMEPWIEVLSKANASTGKYAVMGNHDYATYEHDFTEEEKANSINTIKEYHHRAGYQMLDNSHQPIIIGTDTIYIAGVENWGRGPFPALGDIDTALDGIPYDGFTILLSHDPSHYEDIVSTHSHMVDLTLSGHTHAMQCGIEINEHLRWSPVKYIYKYWAGLYEENGRKLYVNRGLGYHFFPARVGIRPEITLITLHSEQKK